MRFYGLPAQNYYFAHLVLVFLKLLLAAVANQIEKRADARQKPKYIERVLCSFNSYCIL